MMLDVYGCFDKWLERTKGKIDLKKDYTLSDNLMTLRVALSDFYNNVLLCYYVPKDVCFYINKTIDNLADFMKIKNEKAFLKYLQKLNND